jgi:hypothetical protein
MKTAAIDMTNTKYFRMAGISPAYIRSLKMAAETAKATNKNLRPLLAFINGLIK